MVCIRLGELKAKPLQPHPADLTVMTRHDDPFDKIVHLVPVVALGQCTSNSFRSDMEQGEMFLFDQPLSLFQRNNDSSTSLVVFDYQESVWESGWGFKQTPPVGDFRLVLLSYPLGVRVGRWRSPKGDHLGRLLAP